MLKFLYISDTHIMGITPESRKDNIKETIKNKLRQIGKIADDNNVDFIIHGGDMFDTPDVSNKLCNEVSEIIRNWKPTYVVPGNHDEYGYNINTLPNTKLGVLASTGIVTILDRAHPLYFKDTNGISVGIEGQEYYADIDTGKNNDYAVYSTAKVKILVSHSMLLDHDFIKDVPHTKIDDVITTADVVLTGHYHPGYSFKEVNDTAFINLGSILRRENTTDNQQRIPQCLIVEINDAGEFNFTPIALTVEPYADVFKNTAAAKNYDDMLVKFDNKIVNHTFNGIDILQMLRDYQNQHPEDSELIDEILTNVSKAQTIKGVDKGFVPSNDIVYLEEIELVNFQGHEHKIIKFVKGLNIIEGSSGVGKSTIFRAIYFCLYNKPDGSDFITTGRKNCSVKIKLSNGYSIERKRTRTSAGEYILTDKNGNAQSYKGFSNNIPVEITNAHQMPEIEINKTKYRLNISDQLQLNGPFLVGNTSNDKLAIIGALVDTDILDNLRAKFNAEKIKFKADKKRYDALIENKQNELLQYDNLTDIQNKVAKITAVVEQMAILEENIANILNTKKEYDSLTEENQKLEDLLNKIVVPDVSELNIYNSLINEIEQYQQLASDYYRFIQTDKDIKETYDKINSHFINKSLIDDFNNNVNEIDELSKLLNEYRTLSSNKYEFDFDIDSLASLQEEYISLINDIDDAVKINEEFKKLSNDDLGSKINEINIEIEKLNKERQQIVEELKSQELTCPYCHQKIVDIDAVLKE